jgi:predicted DNA-binding WGR domain protein
VIESLIELPLPNREQGHRSPSDLFSTIRLVRNWGRIGTNGQELVGIYETEDGKALEVFAAAKRRRGYRDL